MMEKLSLQTQHVAKHRVKYLIVLAALVLFVSGTLWIDNLRNQDIVMSSYHGAYKENDNTCHIKVNVTFDVDDKMTLMKMIQDKSECSQNRHFVKAESYAEFKTVSLEKQTFVKANVKGFVQYTTGTKNFNDSRFMGVTLQRNRDKLVLIVSYKDIFPLSEMSGDINDKLVFMLVRDR